MRFKVLLLLFALSAASFAIAGGTKQSDNEVQRKSNLYRGRTLHGSFPIPFTSERAQVTGNPLGVNPKTQPAVSTGYYFVDSDDDAPDYWRPFPDIVDTNVEPSTWRRILSGAHQLPPEFWINNPDGNRFFQNPATKTVARPFGVDSTDNAFAGPIPIGFPFYFNGVRYDSFYVSTNGLIGLSNRRYNYGDDGSRVSREIAPNIQSFYDPQMEDTRAQAGGASDPTPDDYGYRCVALGRAANTATINETTTNQTDGIRNPTNVATGTQDGTTTTVTSGTIAFQNFTNDIPLIAPFWGNLQASVYNAQSNSVDDWSKVYYKRSVSGDRLIIAFYNMIPRGTWNTAFGPVTFNADARNGQGNYIHASAIVTLNRLDSSVTVTYTDFAGSINVSGRVVFARDFFRWNTLVGVRGRARHRNYNSVTQSYGTNTVTLGSNTINYTPYRQYTIYSCQTSGQPDVRGSVRSPLEENSTPSTSLAVKFKQWKNTIRSVTTEYRVRPRDPNAALDYSVVVPSANVNNFELLAGDQRLGSIVPIAIFQNLSNDLQSPNGVNYQRQNVKFRTRFRIMNEATGRVVYNRLVRVNSFFSDNSNFTIGGYRLGTFTQTGTNPPVFTAATPSNLDGVPPYGYVQVQFPPFEPNEFVDDQIGRFKVFIIAEPVDSTDQGYNDAWPFDDTTNVTLFTMRRLSTFNEDIREYHVVSGTPMPSVLKFVNIDGEVNDGDLATNNPPPPRGEFSAANNPNFKMKTPVVQLNRKMLGGGEPATLPGGDELRSFPIDLRGRKGAVLSFAYHRTEKRDDYPRGWTDQLLIGPEARIYANGNFNSVVIPGSGTNPDRLFLEFARPSNDQVNNIVVTPIPGSPTFLWNQHYRANKTVISDNPAISIYGGGGYGRGFDEVVKDSALTVAEGMRVGAAGTGLNNGNTELFDDGKDYEWKKQYVPIPDTVLRWFNDGARNFRFRFRVNAAINSSAPNPNDDDDNFFIKNVRILFPSEVTDIEPLIAQANWPYTEAPASQITQVPMRARVANNTGRDAQGFNVTMYAGTKGDQNGQIGGTDLDMRYYYVRTITVPFLPGNRDIEIPFPNWNARRAFPAGNTPTNKDFIVSATIAYPGGDLEPSNDSTFSEINMRLGPTFAYEPAGGQNAVPTFSLTTGRGLNLLGSRSPFAGGEYGANGGNGSGQFAVRFTLYTQDTLFGYQTYFAELNQDANSVTFDTYPDQANLTPRGNAYFPGATLRTGRGWDDVQGGYFYGRYVTNLLPNPIVLAPGDYWVSVAQLSSVGIELGASDYGMGMAATQIWTVPGQEGIGANFMLLNKKFRRRDRVTQRLLNDNRFAFENTRYSGEWQPFTPSTGNPAYAHLSHLGFVPSINTFSRGSWIPMLRPYLGNRNYGNEVFTKVTPVEMVAFDAEKRGMSVDLWWETASEKNNSGFAVERKVAGSNWQEIGFVRSQASAGNSTTTLNYSFNDANVRQGNSYEYRLRQVDLDGRQEYTRAIAVEFEGNASVELGQNSPNPFTSSTNIGFSLSSQANVRLEILDMMGNTVKSLVNRTVSAGNQSIEWDGTDNSGADVANGTYMYRLTVGEKVLTNKMSLVR